MKMLTIYDWRGKERVLSDEAYKIVSLSSSGCLGSNYKVGTKVRLISGVDESPFPGYHFAPDYVTVCRIDATVAEFVGLKRCEIALWHRSIFTIIKETTLSLARMLFALDDKITSP